MSEKLEIGMGNVGGASISMADPSGNEDFKVTGNDQVSLDTDDLPEKDEDEGADADGQDDVSGEDGDKASDESSDADGDAEEGAEGDEDETSGELKDLGDFTPEKAEEFDAQYTKDGQLDIHGALSQEYFANVEKGVDGLNEGTYAYLEAKGIAKATVKDIEAMAATQRDAQKTAVKSQDMELMTRAGGPDALQAAIAWGKEGGYDEAAQKRFNKVMSGKDVEAKKDAIDALMSRFGKAKPKPKLPGRDATKGQGKTPQGPKPFKDRSEFHEARRKAGENQKAQREVALRLAASKFDA
jgi:hypothetical protein